MYTIKLDFENIKEAPLEELFGALGVYVLWNPSAYVKPTNIGEGFILDRVLSHHHDDKWLSGNFIGIYARTDGSATPLRAKHDSAIAEAFLLTVADILNCFPPKNQSGGCINKLYALSKHHGKLKLLIKGYHPFIKPDKRHSRLDDWVELSVIFNQVDLDDSKWILPPWHSK